LPVLEALDAELPLLRGERGLVLPADADEGREVGALARQVLGELEADARRGGIRIDRVVEQPEAVILTHALVLLTHLGDLARLERSAQCIERRTPLHAVGIGARDHDQTLGLFGGVAGALIGDICAGGGATEPHGLPALPSPPTLPPL